MTRPAPRATLGAGVSMSKTEEISRLRAEAAAAVSAERAASNEAKRLRAALALAEDEAHRQGRIARMRALDATALEGPGLFVRTRTKGDASSPWRYAKVTRNGPREATIGGERFGPGVRFVTREVHPDDRASIRCLS